MAKNEIHEKDEIVDVNEIIKDFKNNYIVFIISFLIIFGGTVYYIISTEPVYRSSMVVTVQDRFNEQNPLANFSKAQSVIGLSNKNKNINSFIVTLTSNKLSKRLIRKYDIAKTLFSGSWDSKTQSWERPNNIKFRLKAMLKRFFGYPVWLKPNSPEAVSNKISKLVTVEKFSYKKISNINASNTNIYKIRAEMSEKKYAKQFLEIVYEEAIQINRNKRIDKLNKKIAFLKQQLNEVTLKTLKKRLAKNLVNTQQRLLLLREGEAPNGMDVIDPPITTPYPVKPKMINMLLYAGIGSIGFGVFMSVLFTIRRIHRYAISVDK